MADDGAAPSFETSANVAGVSIREAQGTAFPRGGADIGWRAGRGYKMSGETCDDAEVIRAWNRNAEAWTAAVRAGAIESRRLVTDAAILAAVLQHSPARALDIGCGEGWLARALDARGVKVVGVDVAPGLIEAARKSGGGDFRTMSYEDIAAGKLDLCVDAIVCNFSLIGKESVDGLIAHAPRLLAPKGALIVQTLHPLVACGALPYRDGWRDGSWAGIEGAFADPAPWYFRTIESWMRLFAESGFRATGIIEPVHPQTQMPASIIFIARLD
jgi:2-polyprenyl-3-methyl-5-hydroxy-6-metoxy-1,4-benzoquinol methylase